jgi:hypothetical protein
VGYWRGTALPIQIAVLSGYITTWNKQAEVFIERSSFCLFISSSNITTRHSNYTQGVIFGGGAYIQRFTVYSRHTFLGAYTIEQLIRWALKSIQS